MKIDQCPKKLRNCPEKMCPMFPCWAYNEQIDRSEGDQRRKDSGWE